MFAALTLVALVLEAIFGYPDRLFTMIGHPVTWFGRLIDGFDRHWNQPRFRSLSRILLGGLTIAALLAAGSAAGIFLQWAGRTLLPELAATFAVGLLATSLLAQRSLHRHVAAVRDALANPNSLDPARSALSMIVGRDTAALDESEIARAAIESLAENFSDGVVAPAFWLAVGGLPGGLAYKAVNTADSMIGHRSEKYEAFGKIAARLDDVANLPASRLTALLIVLAAAISPGMNARAAIRAVRSDASHHTSPNAGWPEAAMAGSLGIALAGPRRYAGVQIDAATMNPSGRRDAKSEDIDRALRLFRKADGILIALIAAIAFSILA